MRSPSRSEVSRAIALAAAYLERACGPDGRFVYQIDTASGQETGSYNIVRHAGAIYALAMLNRSQPDHQVRETMLRTAAFLRQNYISEGIRPGQSVVWSKPLSERSRTGFSAVDLGASALGLVALAAVNEAAPGTIPLTQLQALGRFVLFLQRDDGSFISRYIAEKGPVSNWESLYYPGEVALGLISLYRADHSREWLMAAAKALSYLARSRAGLVTVPADHWALIATAELFRYGDRIGSTVSREELVQHAIQICNSVLREQVTSSAAAGLDGAFDPAGRTTPAATRLEGLLAALEFLPKDRLPNGIEAGAGNGIAFLLRAQITSGRYAGGLPGAVTIGVRHSSEVRIDYVQHALCAWLRYQRLFQKSSRPTVNPKKGTLRVQIPILAFCGIPVTYYSFVGLSEGAYGEYIIRLSQASGRKHEPTIFAGFLSPRDDDGGHDDSDRGHHLFPYIHYEQGACAGSSPPRRPLHPALPD